MKLRTVRRLCENYLCRHKLAETGRQLNSLLKLRGVPRVSVTRFSKMLRDALTAGLVKLRCSVDPCRLRPEWAVRDAYTSHRSQFIRPSIPPSDFLLTGLPLLTHTLIIEEERPEETPPGRFPFLSSDNSDQTQPRRFSRAWCFDVCIPQNIEVLHGFGIRAKRDRDLAD